MDFGIDCNQKVKHCTVVVGFDCSGGEGRIVDVLEDDDTWHYEIIGFVKMQVDDSNQFDYPD